MKKNVIKNKKITVISILFIFALGTICNGMEEKKPTKFPPSKFAPSLRLQTALTIAKQILQDKNAEAQLQKLPLELRDYVQLLVDTNLDLNKALWLAVANFGTYSISIIADLIEATGDIDKVAGPEMSKILEKPNILGNTLLTFAIAKKSPDLVQLLLEHGANVMQINKKGMFPIIWASVANSKEIVDLLVKYGADINQKDPNAGMTPLMWNIYYHPSPLFMTEVLLKHRAKVDEQDNNGRTALMFAIGKNYPDVVNTLLQHKANVNLKDQNGAPALMYAIPSGDLKIITTLLQHGADVNNANHEGVSPLIVAVQNNHPTIATTLINHKANIDHHDRNNETALIHAANKGSVEMVQLLLDHGAGINRTDIDGFTALMLAAQSGSYPVAKLLLERGANKNLTNNDGETALQLAHEEGHSEIEELLARK